MSRHGLDNLLNGQELSRVTFTVMYPSYPGRGAHRAGITHKVRPGDSGRTQCCGRLILELPHYRDRITNDAALVTCDGTP